MPNENKEVNEVNEVNEENKKNNPVNEKTIPNNSEFKIENQIEYFQNNDHSNE